MTVQAPQTRRMLTIAEVADRLGVSSDWLYTQARQGRLPVVALGTGTHGRGRVLRVSEVALDAWVAARRSA